MRRLCLLLLACLAAAGCGIGPGEQREAGAELRVTRDFGQKRLASARLERVREGQTVMRFLSSQRRVETRYGGGFVQSIDGIEGEGPAGRRDWFYFVNGIEADVGAAERTLAPGDVVQWDFRRWDRAQAVPAIVGAYPEPFLHGSEGKRFPVRLECEDDRSRACAEVRRRLGDDGVPVSIGPFGEAAGEETLRVIVARWARARAVEAAGALARGPERSGVFARFAGGAGSGGALELLDADGRVARRAPPGSGLLAASAIEGRQLAWIVTGIDHAGVERAARALDERTLRDAFAVAALPSGPERLPVGGAG